MKQGARFIPARQVFVVDLQTPRQRGGATKELLVEPVAEATNRLRQRQGGRHRSQRVGHRQSAATSDVEPDHDTECDATPDAEAALPDLEHVAEAPVETFPIGDHVIDACADDTGGHRPDGDAACIVARAPTARLKPATHQPGGGNCAERDHEAVGIEAQRAEFE